MRARQLSNQSILLLAALALAGCDMITGADKKKSLDAEAIGYACRVSQKVPEDCMKENEAQSPTAILNGWKKADSDIVEQVLDPSMGKKPAAAPAAPPAAPAAAGGEAKAVTEKGVEKVAAAKGEKPAAAAKQAEH
ncbi:MAG: hypothetical protein PHP70_05030 [Gallionella sp.]|nr:hypothetical protein [Gallionella sp.]